MVFESLPVISPKLAVASTHCLPHSVHETKREGNGWPGSLGMDSWPKRPSISSGTPHYQRNDGGGSPTEPASACSRLAGSSSPEIKKRIPFACAWFLEEEAGGKTVSDAFNFPLATPVSRCRE